MFKIILSFTLKCDFEGCVNKLNIESKTRPIWKMNHSLRSVNLSIHSLTRLWKLINAQKLAAQVVSRGSSDILLNGSYKNTYPIRSYDAIIEESDDHKLFYFFWDVSAHHQWVHVFHSGAYTAFFELFSSFRTFLKTYFSKSWNSSEDLRRCCELLASRAKSWTTFQEKCTTFVLFPKHFKISDINNEIRWRVRSKPLTGVSCDTHARDFSWVSIFFSFVLSYITFE